MHCIKSMTMVPPSAINLSPLGAIVETLEREGRKLECAILSLEPNGSTRPMFAQAVFAVVNKVGWVAFSWGEMVIEAQCYALSDLVSRTVTTEGVLL